MMSTAISSQLILFGLNTVSGYALPDFDLSLAMKPLSA